MPKPAPRPISIAVKRSRHDRIARLARDVGFVGRVEYKHVYSQSGGAQYGQGTTIASDLLTVYCEAFERDANPEEFSLEAIIAHERGHQLLVRHPRLAPSTRAVSGASQEILASVLGAIICTESRDREELLAKAAAELVGHGEAASKATRRILD